MRRAISPKSSPLRRLVGAAGGVETVGTDVGGVCAGAKEPPPEGAVNRDSTMGVAVGYVCKGVLCPPLVESADDEPDWAITGGEVEVFTIGSPDKEDTEPGVWLVGLGVP